MSLSENPRQLVMLLVVSFLMSSGCDASGSRSTATRQQPTSTASPTHSAAVPVTQDWIARHREEDRVWAERTSLTTEQVRQLRLAADVPDDEAASIVNLDTQNLKVHNHVLLVTAGGNGHCLELVIFNREGNEFRRIWSLGELPGARGGICRESSLDPEAYATPDGKLVVKLPVFDYNSGTAKTTELYTYVWDGKSYEHTDDKSRD